ncbi:MAG: DUF5675 family protein [Prevotella sp.]|nr:DUF5675 family protein [Prevotella sp.]
MKLLLVRKKFLADRTLGELYVEGIGWYCDTLEPHSIDWSKEKKVKGKTAIPEGKYKVKIAWSNKHGRMVPWLQNVPHFDGIQIHTGNVPKHSAGCILVGIESANCLMDSNLVFRKLMDHIKREKEIEIEVTSETEDTSSDEYFNNVISKFL